MSNQNNNITQNNISKPTFRFKTEKVPVPTLLSKKRESKPIKNRLVLRSKYNRVDILMEIPLHELNMNSKERLERLLKPVDQTHCAKIKYDDEKVKAVPFTVMRLKPLPDSLSAAVTIDCNSYDFNIVSSKNVLSYLRNKINREKSPLVVEKQVSLSISCRCLNYYRMVKALNVERENKLRLAVEDECFLRFVDRTLLLYNFQKRKSRCVSELYRSFADYLSVISRKFSEFVLEMHRGDLLTFIHEWDSDCFFEEVNLIYHFAKEYAEEHNMVTVKNINILFFTFLTLTTHLFRLITDLTNYRSFAYSPDKYYDIFKISVPYMLSKNHVSKLVEAASNTNLPGIVITHFVN